MSSFFGQRNVYLLRKYLHPQRCIVTRRRLLSTNRDVVRVRFGPSPTGYLHLGGLRTAFFNYLFAKQHHGSFILRIEDTDQDRIVADSLQNIVDMLLWTGLVPDEGPHVGGQYGPYLQSQRTELYREMIDKLLATPVVYRCFCSEMRLNLLRKEQLKNRETVKYDNRCRHLTQKEIDEKLANGDKFTVRLKLKSGSVTFDDLVYGRRSFDLSMTESDPILMKSDGLPTYHFANVVDDHHMNITHVLRGAEWQVSTPKHLMLYEAFGWTPPVFAHLPLLLNKDNTKLSKRQNDIRIDYYRDHGYYPETLLNFLTTFSSGFTHRTTEDTVDRLDDLTKMFSIERVNTNHGKIETEKLKLLNRYSIYWYLNNGYENKLIDELKCLLKEKFGSTNELNLDENYLLFLISWSKERIFTLKDLLSEEFLYLWKVPDFSWNVNQVATAEECAKVLETVIYLLENLNENDCNAKYIYEIIRNEFNDKFVNVIKFKKFMKILRLSLTNIEAGSPIGETVVLLGRNRSIDYLKSAISYINTYRSGTSTASQGPNYSNNDTNISINNKI
ncbi:probable glutamate--tRNA ligase, mitochondrial [Oppia nitens]|uniref:probable glutamate--tRNA ligase, mitochondrial n=1 Tax=Oppia nitens TaxID=1686743 RepID=UPI0023DA0388|nr:probable glutamate--tRNA ligase, mitochondrial [Oppia nitens]